MSVLQGQCVPAKKLHCQLDQTQGEASGLELDLQPSLSSYMLSVCDVCCAFMYSGVSV